MDFYLILDITDLSSTNSETWSSINPSTDRTDITNGTLTRNTTTEMKYSFARFSTKISTQYKTTITTVETTTTTLKYNCSKGELFVIPEMREKSPVYTDKIDEIERFVCLWVCFVLLQKKGKRKRKTLYTLFDTKISVLFWFAFRLSFILFCFVFLFRFVVYCFIYLCYILCVLFCFVCLLIYGN